MFLTRAYEDADLSVRGDGRTVYGYAVPFNVDVIVNDGFGDYVERFASGAFKNVVRAAHKVKFQYQHADDLLAWVGNAVLLREDNVGLYGEYRLDDNERGRHVAYKIADGQLPGLSVSFIPARDERSRTKEGMHRITRTLVKLVDHIAAVRNPAYLAPEPLMVREHSARAESSVDHWRTWRAGLMVNNDA